MSTEAQKKKNRSSISLTQTEIVVSKIWGEVLQHDRIGPGDNFFELGGDSIMTMMVLFQVNDILHVDLPSGAVFEAPTLREFCHMIDSSKNKPGSQYPPGNLSLDFLEEDTGSI